MKNVFKQLLGMFLALAFLSSCGDNDDDQPIPPGSIKVTVTPAGAATALRVTKDGITTEVNPDANSVFLAQNLTEGQYSVTFTPSSGYQAPDAQSVTVTAGETTNLGTVNMQRIVIPGTSGSMTASLNGTPWSSAFSYANMSNNSLRIFGPTASGTSGEVMVLSIENFSGTGTFTGFPNAVGGYSLNMGSPSPQTWDSSTGSCTITISSFNPTDSLITGTFSFVARPSSTFIVPGNTATGTKTITNGTFTNVKIQ